MNTCGIDEVGKGALAGPLVVACVSFKDYSNIPLGIKDSKTTSLKYRTNLYKKIVKCSEYGIGIISSSTIDRIGIKRSTEAAVLISFNKLECKIDQILLDGNLCLKSKIKKTIINKGDSNYVSIAAASIIAKCTRDRIMINISKKYPYYGWQTNVGYGTKEHLLALRKYGISKYHRKCYAPIRNLNEANEIKHNAK